MPLLILDLFMRFYVCNPHGLLLVNFSQLQSISAATLAGLVCVACVLALIGMFVGAVILRAACALHNKMDGGREDRTSVTVPSFACAMRIVFVATLVNFVIGFVIGFTVAMFFGDSQQARVLAFLLHFPTSVFVLAVLISDQLPTSFVKGLIIALLYVVVAIAIAALFIIPIVFVPDLLAVAV